MGGWLGKAEGPRQGRRANRGLSRLPADCCSTTAALFDESDRRGVGWAGNLRSPAFPSPDPAFGWVPRARSPVRRSRRLGARA